MEVTPAPRLFNSGEICWKIIRASIMEYLSRDIFYGRLFGMQVFLICACLCMCLYACTLTWCDLRMLVCCVHARMLVCCVHACSV
jgi:hypothetical protein